MMKVHGRLFAQGAFAIAALAGMFLSSACTRIATPTVTTVVERSAVIPFELYRGDRIVLPGRINGTETAMILDSGAGVTALDRAFAQTIGLTGGQRITVGGLGGQQDAELFQKVTLEVGNLTFSGATMVALDLSQVAKAIGRPITVVLGRELFVSSVIGLDFDRGELTLSPSRNFTAPAGATEIKLKREGRLHVMPVSIAGLPPVNAAFDLGNGGTLGLSQEYHVQHPLFASLPYALSMGGGVGGWRESRSVTLPRVEVGGFAFDAVPAGLESVPGGPHKGGANIGIQMFRPFKLTMDLGHDRLWLQRNSRPVEFPRDRSGLFTMLEGDHFSVLHVSPGSPADHAGLKKGDMLTAINRTAVDPAFFNGALANWAQGTVGTRTEVTKSDGTTVVLTLADYY